MGQLEQIYYELGQVRQQADGVQEAGSEIRNRIQKSLEETASDIAGAWTGPNRDAYEKKLMKISTKAGLIGTKLIALGKSMEYSANTIVAAEQAAVSIIIGR